jgi:ATP-dependent helicase Lhr and Lhr-like helicase
MHSIQQLLPRAYGPFFGHHPQLRPAQEQVIPIIMEGRNVLLISPTGSGKTEAMVAPLAEQATSKSQQLFCLYICPTRALVNDIERRIGKGLQKMHLRVAVRHGDRKTLRGKTVPSFLVTTPESLDVMLGRGADRQRLQAVQAVVIDEVHQFYQTHRGYQLILLLERLKQLTKTPLQRLLLSATVARPESMARWFQGSDSAFEIVNIQGGRQIEVTLDLLTASDGKTFFRGDSVVEALRSIVERHKKVLMFANSRNECNWLSWRLNDALGIETLLHYSSLDKAYREEVERRFQQSSRALCIATSTLELGIDIGDVDAVVMYGAPSSISSFVQRVGRGNRRSDRCVVYGLCRDYHINGNKLGADHDALLLYALVAAMQDSEIEDRPETKLYSVLVQQLFSLTDHYRGEMIARPLIKVLENAQVSPLDSSEDVEQLLEFLATRGYFTYRPDVQSYYATEKWQQVKRRLQLWGNIASQPHDTVIDADQELPVSDIPQGAARPGRIILVAGQPRLVTDISGRVVKVVNLNTEEPEMIVYETPSATTPPEVAQKVASLLQVTQFPNLPVELDDSLAGLLRKYRRRFSNVPLTECVPFTREDGRFCYYLFGGTWAHELMALALRKRGYRTNIDSWRVYTSELIETLDFLPTSIADLEQLVCENLPAFIHKMGFSEHFERLPEAMQQREICSLLNLPRLSVWLSQVRNKKVRPVSV